MVNQSNYTGEEDKHEMIELGDVEILAMSAYGSMLRGINVGGQKKIRMDTLRGIYEELGFTKVRTYVQSGNVVFASTEQNPSNLVKQIEARIEQACGYPVPVFIRQSHDLKKILTDNPFLNGRNENPIHLHVTFLYRPPPKTAWSRLATPGNTSDEFYRGEMAIYLYCPNG